MKITYLFLAMLFLIGCSQKQIIETPVEANNTKQLVLPPLSIKQDGKSFDIKKGFQSIRLSKEAFDIEFPLKIYNPELELFNSLKICAQEKALGMEHFKIGFDTNDPNSVFAQGKGMAADGIYDKIYIADAFHYIIYIPGMSERCKKIKQLDAGTIHASMPVNMISYQEESYPIESFPKDRLFLIFFNDNNLDAYVDAGEMKQVEIIFQ